MTLDKMSKQSEAKKNQNYGKDYNCCGNCINYMFDEIAIKSQYTNKAIIEIKNKRCKLGGFAVNVSACCDKWEKK